ncbi:hypothetical protein AB8U03_02660 [Clostridium sp. Mt-5]|uniref:Uncharacterized protein n=1 Tax=Clostridium moutaii TaxID=3240932 RepID=A0ABV4BMT8_9CLOT
MDNNINKTKAIIAIMATGLLIMGIGATSPALASIAQAFPNVSPTLIMLIATLPPLVLVPFSLLTGKLAGSKLKYKTLAVIGIILFVIGGFLSVFFFSLIESLFSIASDRFPFVFGMICYASFAVIYAIITVLKPKENDVSSSMSSVEKD